MRLVLACMMFVATLPTGHVSQRGRETKPATECERVGCLPDLPQVTLRGACPSNLRFTWHPRGTGAGCTCTAASEDTPAECRHKNTRDTCTAAGDYMIYLGNGCWIEDFKTGECTQGVWITRTGTLSVQVACSDGQGQGSCKSFSVRNGGTCPCSQQDCTVMFCLYCTSCPNWDCR